MFKCRASHLLIEKVNGNDNSSVMPQMSIQESNNCIPIMLVELKKMSVSVYTECVFTCVARGDASCLKNKPFKFADIQSYKE